MIVLLLSIPEAQREQALTALPLPPDMVLVEETADAVRQRLKEYGAEIGLVLIGEEVSGSSEFESELRTCYPDLAIRTL